MNDKISKIASIYVWYFLNGHWQSYIIIKYLRYWESYGLHLLTPVYFKYINYTTIFKLIYS